MKILYKIRSVCLLLVFLWITPLSTLYAEEIKTGNSPVDTLSAENPIRRSFAKRFIAYFSDANKVSNKKFNFSVIGGPFYSSDTKFGLGLAGTGLYSMDRRDTLLQPSNVSLYGSISTVGFFLLGVQGNNLFPHDRHRLNYNAYFYSFPSYYWGTGYENASNDDNQSHYEQFKVQFKIDFMTRVAHNFYIGPIVQFDHFDARKAKRPELWEGRPMRTINFGVGFSIIYDSRDYITNAYRGYYLRIDQTFNPSFLGNKNTFITTQFTTSYYQPVWKGGVLAAQLHGWFNFGKPSWGLMATLGSSDAMRGYYEGRYRDKCAMDTQLELRQRVWRRIGVAGWVGAGTVFPDFKHFDTRNILPNYGVGLRWEFKKRVNIRLDMGFGKSGQRGFIFNINEAF